MYESDNWSLSACRDVIDINTMMPGESREHDVSTLKEYKEEKKLILNFRHKSI